MTNKREVTYNKLFKNLIEIEPDLNPSHIMVDFEKASLNALEENFIAVVSGCFFHLSQSIYRQIQAKGLTTQYLEDQDFAIRMKMLASLAFVPEHDVIDSFIILMGDFPESILTFISRFLSHIHILIFSYYVYIIIALSLNYPHLVIINVHGTKSPETKCPWDEMSGTKCPWDEMSASQLKY